MGAEFDTGAGSLDARRIARLAGFFYLVIIVCGVWSEFFVRSTLVDPLDAARTAENLRSASGMFRLSLAADTVMAASDVTVGVLLYVLLRPVSMVVALLAMVFRLIQAAVLAMNILGQHVALSLAATPGLDPSTASQLALLSMSAQSHGYDLGLIFFGVNSVLTGWLVARSGFLPRPLGWGLVAAGLVYLAGSYLRFLLPEAHAAFQPAYLVTLVAELAFCLYLLARGVDTDAWRNRGAAGA